MSPISLIVLNRYSHSQNNSLCPMIDISPFSCSFSCWCCYCNKFLNQWLSGSCCCDKFSRCCHLFSFTHHHHSKAQWNMKGCPFIAPILLLESCSHGAWSKLVHPIRYEEIMTMTKMNHNQISAKQPCAIKWQDFFIDETTTSVYT